MRSASVSRAPTPQKTFRSRYSSGCFHRGSPQVRGSIGCGPVDVGVASVPGSPTQQGSQTTPKFIGDVADVPEQCRKPEVRFPWSGVQRWVYKGNADVTATVDHLVAQDTGARNISTPPSRTKLQLLYVSVEIGGYAPRLVCGCSDACHVPGLQPFECAVCVRDALLLSVP